MLDMSIGLVKLSVCHSLLTDEEAGSHFSYYSQG